MATSTAVTAWGKPKIRNGASGNNGTLGSTLTDVGKIKEDSTSLEVVNGDVKELFGEGHELLDKMELEGTWVLKYTMVKAPIEKVAEAYGLTLVSGKLPMRTTVVTEPRSYVVEPKLVGAICAELPNCSTKLTPRLVAADGWTIDVEATTMTPEDETVAPCTLYPKPAPNEG